MLEAALRYYDEGLCVIPVVYGDKMPALKSWEEYQERRSSKDEIVQWFESPHNVGIVHGEVSGGYVSLDIDHDNGLLKVVGRKFPHLVEGRIEQSGSMDGYHVPLLLEELPDFGENKGQPKGNKTWKVKEKGKINIRARRCQTVVPPSLHPSGNQYHFIQDGPIVQRPNLNDLLYWLRQFEPPKREYRKARKRDKNVNSNGNSLLEAALGAWTPLDVFKHFGLANKVRDDARGEIRLLGNGGLLINQDEGEWYCFEEEVGGGPVEAWGWCRHGSAFDKQRQFRETLLEMAQAAGIDTARFYKKGDEQVEVEASGNKSRWSKQGVWGKMRR